ncbi:MAG: HlyD family efflux transporter periplasmic adaptor subunit [Planctomycetes bacterium]|nr:HlyD family efflux transporter periplasmic adaptor subunit [Planctomycetota bacterium]MBI3832936.1 HlyD family efflux transporter periplasmic adaptor subunit [Planctomycetota bacterium]
MKNLIIAILAVSTLVAGYMVATAKLRLGIENVEGKTEKIIRGDLTLPINATGEVKPGLRVQIKSEASGEVTEITHKASDLVKKGELMIRLNPDDEQRSVDRARQDLQVAEARKFTAQLILEQARSADLQAAQAHVDALIPAVEMSQFRLNKILKMDAALTNDEELLERRTAASTTFAQLGEAKATLERAKIAIPRAEQDLRSAEANYESAKASLADAEKRLFKTKIVSPVDGVVSDIFTQIGEVVQGGKTTLTGGTVLAVVLDLDKRMVQAEVDESEIGRVLALAPPWAKPGHEGTDQMPADVISASAKMENLPSITVESFRSEKFTGVIERIYPEPKSISGVVTYLVEVVVVSDNRSLLLPGMRAEVTFTSERVNNALLCPNEAIRESSRGGFGVYIPKPGVASTERETQFVPCKFGLDNGTYSEVRDGLAEGQVVYIKLPSKSDNKDKEKKEKRKTG